MARIKLSMPEAYIFQTKLPTRITDLNYGGHVGNDAILGLIHEARLHFLAWRGYTELNIAGVGLIMADVAIEFKQELFYPDVVTVSMVAADFTRVGFDIYYKLEKEESGQLVPVAFAKTAMVCYDYAAKKTRTLPSEIPGRLGLVP